MSVFVIAKGAGEGVETGTGTGLGDVVFVLQSDTSVGIISEALMLN